MKLKTRITNIKKSKNRFLGVDFFIKKTVIQEKKPTQPIKKDNTSIKLKFSAYIIYRAPINELLNKLVTYKFVKRNQIGELVPTGKVNYLS
jgi:hypothetical protein